MIQQEILVSWYLSEPTSMVEDFELEENFSESVVVFDNLLGFNSF